MLPQSSIAVAVYARVVLTYIEKQADTVTGLVVVVLGFDIFHQQLRSYGDGYRTGKNRFNSLFLFLPIG